MKFLFLITSLVFANQVFAKEKKTIDREDIRQVIKKNISSIKTCYSDRLKTKPDIEGSVVVEWDISADGSVSKADIKTSSLKDEIVENCVIDKIKSLKYPVPPHGTIPTISYPFTFSKNN